MYGLTCTEHPGRGTGRLGQDEGKYVLSVPSIDAFESMNVQAPCSAKISHYSASFMETWC